MGKRYNSYSVEGKFLYDALRCLGIGIQEFADKTGISRVTMTRFLQGKGTLPETRAAIYDTLHILTHGCEPTLFTEDQQVKLKTSTVSTSTASTSTASMLIDWNFCPWCGASIEPWNYCPCCGATLRGE